MPELPEVENVRRLLDENIQDHVVLGVRINRLDVIKSARPKPRDRSRKLLVGGSLCGFHRHGKRLALEINDGRVLEFSLGMSGQLIIEKVDSGPPPNHAHLIWTLKHPGNGRRRRLLWRDPRRFGGVWIWPSMKAMIDHKWSSIGVDALEMKIGAFKEKVGATRRSIKTALLDQNLIAGIGNIYADEVLHRAGIRPRRMAARLRQREMESLHDSVQTILTEAVEAGGSTIQSFKDPRGGEGRYQGAHAVYGRQGGQWAATQKKHRTLTMVADDASDAEALFCLELYVHRVERLPRRLRETPPALALRFLDYAPVVVEPPSGARGNHRGSCWYGCGKRCVFEAREGELAKKLSQRRDAALLCHAVEAGRPVRRRLYGSSKVALPNFGENEENEAPLGAVRTWGRAECRVLLENAHGRVVGAEHGRRVRQHVAGLERAPRDHAPAVRDALVRDPRGRAERGRAGAGPLVLGAVDREAHGADPGAVERVRRAAAEAGHAEVRLLEEREVQTPSAGRVGGEHNGKGAKRSYYTKKFSARNIPIKE